MRNINLIIILCITLGIPILYEINSDDQYLAFV